MSQLKEPTQEQIRERAYKFFVDSGWKDGRELDNWLAAENELKDISSGQRWAVELESEVDERRLPLRRKSADVGFS